MELKEFLEKLKVYWKLFFAIPLLGSFLGLLLSSYQPTTFNASLLLYVKRVTSPSSDKFYAYDGYYAQQASQEYTDTIVGFLKSLSILYRAAEIANFSTKTEDLEDLKKQIKITKEAPQLVKVNINQSTSKKAKDLVSALAQATQERTTLLNQTGDRDFSVDLVNSVPLVKTVKTSKFLNSLGGFFLGLFFTTLFILGWEYFRVPDSQLPTGDFF